MKSKRRFAVFAVPKSQLVDLGVKELMGLPKCDPLDYGIGNEPEKDLLLRRGRIALFELRCEAEAAIKRTAEHCKDQTWTKKYGFAILECFDREVREIGAV